MAYVRKVAGNVKGMREEGYSLTPCTLVVGPNASGKSTIAETISLALTGRAASEDVGATGGALMALAPPDDGELIAKAELGDDDGSSATAELHVVGSTAKASRPDWTQPPIPATLVMELAHSFLHGDPKRLRAELLQRLGGTVPRADVEARIPGALLPLCGLPGLVDGYSQDDLADASARLREASTAASRARKQAPEEPPALTDAEVEELRYLTAASAARGTSEAEIGRMRAAKGAAEQRAAGLRAELASQQAVSADPVGVELIATAGRCRTIVLGVLREGEHQGCKCPVCRQEVTEQQLVLANTHAAIVRGHLSHTEARAEEQRRLRAELLEVEEEVKGLSRALTQATLAEPIDMDRLRDLQVQQAAVDCYLAIVREKAEAEARHGSIKAAQKAVEGIIADTLEKRLSGFVGRINDALPSGRRAGIVLRDGRRAVCQVTLDGRPAAVLSGAEKAMLLSAFAAALAPENGLRVLIVDDVWFDAKTLEAFLNAARLAVEMHMIDQAIVCAVGLSGAGVTVNTSGWSVIELEG